MERSFQTFTPATQRPGIAAAVHEIVRRHNDGQTATSIVLPPRYGKSDVIRLSAIELIETGGASAALALAPFEQIANQLVAEKKMADMVKRYMHPRRENYPVGIQMQRLHHISNAFHETRDIVHLFTATIQLAQNSLKQVGGWVARCQHFGTRPIVFIDEGQYLSDGNKWGQIAEEVQRENGHVVLLTGTKWRSDREKIQDSRYTKFMNRAMRK